MPLMSRTRARERARRSPLVLLAGGALCASWLLGGKVGTALAGSVPVTISEPSSGSSSSSDKGSKSGSGSQQLTIEEGPSTTSTSTPTSPQPTTTTTSPQATTPTTTPPASSGPSVVQQQRQKPTKQSAKSKRPGGRPGSPAGAPSSANNNSASNNVAPAPQQIAVQAGVLAAELAGSAASNQALSFYRIPLFLLPIYQAAAAQYGVPWQILAAINEIETDYGNDLSVSSAGAVGWMQFMPATWLQYGVDALNAGYADPYNPVDAIFAAARYLRAAGAPGDLNAAILAYNHSNAYLSSVLLRAKLISRYPHGVIAALTGLTDGRLPVRNNRVSWSATAPLISAPNPLAPSAHSDGRASTPATAPAPTAASALAPSPTGSAPPPSPGAASAPPPSPGAVAASRERPAPLKLVDLVTSPKATVVAVQDGRVLKLGTSRKLGRYLILRDVYGDEFTYAGLGSIAPTYVRPKVRRSSVPAKVSVTPLGASDSPPKQAASAGKQVPLTLHVTPRRHSARHAGQAPRPPAEVQAPASGKVRLFAHPDNSDARASAAMRARPKAAPERKVLPLRRGSIVAKGTVLGHVGTPTGARAGHMRFSVRPAGDRATVDPRPIVENWSQLDIALHPQGASRDTDLLGATASGVFLLDQAELQRTVLSDPGIAIYPCGRQDIAAGKIDRRVLAVLAFLSRSGLKPVVSALRCGHGEYTVSGYVSEHYSGDAVDISAIDGIAIAGHQGPGTITDTTIRALLTLQGEYAPHQIISLMRYPGAANTLAMADHWDHIHIGYRPVATAGAPGTATTARAHGRSAPAQPSLLPGSSLSSTQWNQLVTHIAGLPAPAVPAKPSNAAIRDRKQP
jgi:transglycosylase-like protein with SLT domain